MAAQHRVGNRDPTSANGTKRTSLPTLSMPAIGGEADITDAHSIVRF